MRSLHFFRWVNCSVVPGVKPGKRKTEVSVAAAFRHVSDFYGYRISRMASTTQVRCGYDLGTHQVRFHRYRITQMRLHFNCPITEQTLNNYRTLSVLRLNNRFAALPNATIHFSQIQYSMGAGKGSSAMLVSIR